MSYLGPEDNNYFRRTFNSSWIDLLPTLQCGDDFFDTTSDTEPVHYYKMNVSSTTSAVSTCCDDLQIDSASNETFHCENSSLDTVLYTFYRKKSQINLLSVSDDVEAADCASTQKSILHLSDYNSGEYIVGVGGYGTESGAYRISVSCINTTPSTTEENNIGPGSADSASQSGGYVLPILIILVYMTAVCLAWMWHKLRRSRSAEKSSNAAANNANYDHEMKPMGQTQNIQDQSNAANDSKETSDSLYVSINALKVAIGEIETGHALDVCQVLAVRACDMDRNEMSFLKIARIIIPIVIQLFVTTSIVIYLLLAFGSNQGFCSGDAESESGSASIVKALCCLLSIAIFIKVGNLLKRLEHAGLYRCTLVNADDVKISGRALRFGQFLNVLVTVLSGFASYFIIYFARDNAWNEDGTLNVAEVLVEVVLNITALFFMAELDEDLVWSADREYVVQRCLAIKKELEARFQELNDEDVERYNLDASNESQQNTCSKTVDIIRKLMLLVGSVGFIVMMYCW